MVNGVRSCFFPLLIQTQFILILMHYIAGNPAPFINEQGSETNPEYFLIISHTKWKRTV